MVENLLSASRVSEGKLSLKMSTELMDDMITEGIQHLSRRLDSHILERRKAETLLFVKADARLMVQVIINLVDNAIKYTPSGSRICIETAGEGENVVVRIGDDGPGIPEEEKAHIFDLFYTGGNPAGDNRRGLGIGLALCESILKAHGGSIRVKDNVPKGTLFEFTLPKEEVNLNE